MLRQELKRQTGGKEQIYKRTCSVYRLPYVVMTVFLEDVGTNTVNRKIPLMSPLAPKFNSPNLR